eukprot:TRINITY_DN3292_c1_g1_i1.p1 TRINITY_DN3292_c1_g1~~TRINITY_DN3292_c1_g1_i1.p1  ORF type:complete len:523 (+),score=118.65 TRINITY_DN3292_c1_g1_i1:82-1569(+)
MAPKRGRLAYSKEKDAAEKAGQGRVRLIDRKTDWELKKVWSKGLGVMAGKSDKSLDPLEYYEGGQLYYEKERGAQAQAWRDLYSKEIDMVRHDYQAGYAAPAPLQEVRSKKPQTEIDWENIQLNMPVAETTISSRKHATLGHLHRIRTNPKYRWKRGRFVTRDPATIASLAMAKFYPEILCMTQYAEPPKHLDLDKTPIVVCEPHALASASGISEESQRFSGVFAEYFIPNEASKLDLWMKPDMAMQRVAVMVNVQEPQHLGNMIRSSVGMGCDTILLMDNCADPYSTEVLDASLAAQVSEGGYPRFHILRPEDGDDAWGILNRMAQAHDLLPVTLTQGGDAAVEVTSPDGVWRGLAEKDDMQRKIMMFFGSERYGLDPEYVEHNMDREVKHVALGSTSTVGLSASSEAAVLMHALLEPTFSVPNPAEIPKLFPDNQAKVRVITPISREVMDARSRGEELELVPVRPQGMQVSKFYRDTRFGKPAYKTQVSLHRS